MYTHRNSHKHAPAVLFTTAKRKRRCKRPSTGERQNRAQPHCRVFLSHEKDYSTTRQKTLEVMMLGGRSKAQKASYCVIPFM